MGSADLDHEAVASFVNGFNVLLRSEASTQPGDAVGEILGAKPGMAAGGLHKLGRCDDLTGVSQELPQHKQLANGKTNDCFPA